MGMIQIFHSPALDAEGDDTLLGHKQQGKEDS